MKRKHNDRLTIILEKGKRKIVTKTPLPGVDKVVFVINRQFTNAPNTTQISSGAGRSSAAGNNAAILSPLTRQQQSVGAGGKAKNLDTKGRKGRLSANGFALLPKPHGKEVVIVINDQIVKLPKGFANASATQVTSGAGYYSSGGTNAAIESPGTKQQHAVGGGPDSTAVNKWFGKGTKRSRRRRRK
ncbi:hypothetical protein DFP94_108137 [Fontibacillus phaseoli]|uniref:Uncharacterized protein n=1 Tax=Fontibacillus phaseoli TaxID=1416533 RepID=A0A369BB39_9BACL|nr:hypothetical protein [Fontibacillus phaseoli]RCX17776.1 hypothetical protein DFP94_108137 [Fontibacillus phaseoli]